MKTLLKVLIIFFLLITMTRPHAQTDNKEKFPIIEKIATGFQFVEGPVWVQTPIPGLLFSDIPANKIYFWNPASGEAKEWRTPSGNSNGLAIDEKSRLLICQHESRRLARLNPDGSEVALAEKFQNGKFNSPNDLALHPDGSIWFTDPSYGLNGRPAEQPLHGVYRLNPATGAVSLMASDFDQPNGLCFSPDAQYLYIADSGKPTHVRRFKLGANQEFLDPMIFCVVTQGVPDGLKCDRLGNLYVTTGSGVDIYTPEGTLKLQIPLPESPSNIAVVEGSLKILYVTARSSVYRITLN